MRALERGCVVTGELVTFKVDDGSCEVRIGGACGAVRLDGGGSGAFVGGGPRYGSEKDPVVWG